MIQAIGSSGSPPLPRTPGSPAGLEVQLARLQSELSDCVNCASANTAEGKAKIQELSNQINSIRARIESASKSRVPGEVADSTAASRFVVPGVPGADSAVVPPTSETFPPGSFLDLST